MRLSDLKKSAHDTFLEKLVAANPALGTVDKVKNFKIVDVRDLGDTTPNTQVTLKGDVTHFTGYIKLKYDRGSAHNVCNEFNGVHKDIDVHVYCTYANDTTMDIGTLIAGVNRIAGLNIDTSGDHLDFDPTTRIAIPPIGSSLVVDIPFNSNNSIRFKPSTANVINVKITNLGLRPGTFLDVPLKRRYIQPFVYVNGVEMRDYAILDTTLATKSANAIAHGIDFSSVFASVDFATESTTKGFMGSVLDKLSYALFEANIGVKLGTSFRMKDSIPWSLYSIAPDATRAENTEFSHCIRIDTSYLVTLTSDTRVVNPLVLHFNGGNFVSQPDITVALQDLDFTSVLTPLRMYASKSSTALVIKNGYWVCSDELYNALNVVLNANNMPNLPVDHPMATAGSYAISTACFNGLWRQSGTWYKPARASLYANAFKLDNIANPFPSLTHTSGVYAYFN